MDEFKKVHNRKNTRSIKWDLTEEIFKVEDLLPMWIADLDFKAPKEVNEAIMARAKHGIYGYTGIDSTLKEVVLNWLKRRHSWQVSQESLVFCPSVVSSLHIAIKTYTRAGDKVLIQTPVYTPFYKVIEEHDRSLLTNELIYNSKLNKYEIDFPAFEEKLKKGVKAFILCSPHNPVGRVWTKEELTKMAHLCQQYGVLIIADEIHADIVYKGYKHIPIASLSKEIAGNVVTFLSPSKTFNLAGLHASYAVISNKNLRKEFSKALQNLGLNGINTIGIYALEAAYKHGENWLEGLLSLLEENKQYLIEQFKLHAPQLKVIDAEGTYLLWIDCSQLGMDDQRLEEFFLQEAKVALNKGISYGPEGSQFMRINIGCPKPLLEKGLKQILEAVKNLS